MFGIVTKWFGTKSEREIRSYEPIVRDVIARAEQFRSLSDEATVAKTREFEEGVARRRAAAEKEAAEQGLSRDLAGKHVWQAEQGYLEEILPEAFALVKETCRRLVGESWPLVGQLQTWEMVHYDVQIYGAIVLHKGKIAEMKTGEGKTLVATMPIYLNALTGRGVHVVTVNDYLARRDAEWMGRIYERLGLTVGAILNSMGSAERREVYGRSVTYGTNNEFGFDYLRDNMALSHQERVQRGHAYAIVDEVDSILIDEARTPLIISGAVDDPSDSKFREMKPFVERLVRIQTALVNEIVASAERLLGEGKEEEAGLKLLQAARGAPKNRRLQKVFQEQGTKKLMLRVEADYMRDKRLGEVDEELFYSLDEKSHIVDLTEKGRQAISPDNPEMFVIPDLGALLSEIHLHSGWTDDEKRAEEEKARLLHSDRSERIHNIAQLLRAYSLYEKDEEYVVQEGKVLIVDEFTGRLLPGRRYSDGLHQALEAKENVTIERETQTLATITIQNYFRLYRKLAGMTGTAETEAEELHSIYGLDVTVIPTHAQVIRDDRDDFVYKTKREKYAAALEEIAQCHQRGQPVLVGTISVDASETLSRMLERRKIPHSVLNAKQHQREAEIVARAGQRGAVTIATNMAGRGTDIKLGAGVRELGGLHILGTERHEARRIDLQLRGRSGRQGDPGSSQFYLSLEDDLMRLFGSERIAGIMDRLGVKEGEVITHGMVTHSISRAQKKVEVRNFGIRKRLLEYDDVMNRQRSIIYERRQEVLEHSDVRTVVDHAIEEFIHDAVDGFDQSNGTDAAWADLRNDAASHLAVEVDGGAAAPDLRKQIRERADEVYRGREALIPAELMRSFERYVILRTTDEHWKDHLYGMDQLKEGINLRAFGQKDPLLEYKQEGFQMFSAMLRETNREIVRRLFRTQIQGMGEPRVAQIRRARNVRLQHADAAGLGLRPAASPNGASPQERETSAAVASEPRVGRNEPCPCGSGKKFKKCHGA